MILIFMVLVVVYQSGITVITIYVTFMKVFITKFKEGCIMRTEKVEIRLTKKEKESLIKLRDKLGYSSLSEMIRHIIIYSDPKV